MRNMAISRLRVAPRIFRIVASASRARRLAASAPASTRTDVASATPVAARIASASLAIEPLDRFERVAHPHGGDGRKVMGGDAQERDFLVGSVARAAARRRRVR